MLKTIKKVIIYIFIGLLNCSWLTVLPNISKAASTNINPGFIGKTPIIGNSTKVVISSDGNYAYVLSNLGMQVIDISNPANPLVVGNLNPEPVATMLEIATDSADYIYIGVYGKILTVNVSNPEHPIFVSSLSLIGYNRGLFYNNNKLYIANSNYGLRVADVSNRYAPRLYDSFIDTSGEAGEVAVYDQIAVVLDNTDGAVIIDISDINSLIRLGSYDIRSPRDLSMINSNSIYVAAATDGLMEIDISNPANPTLKKQTPMSNAVGVVNDNNRLYVSITDKSVFNDNDGVKIFDLLPGSIQELAYIRNTGLNTHDGVAVANGVIIVAASIGGISIIDGNNLQNNEPIALRPPIDSLKGSKGFTIHNSYLYTLTYSYISSFLYIYDISNPEYPVQVGTLQIDNPTGAITFNDDHLYLADNNLIKVIDIGNPRSPSILSTFDTLNNTLGMTINNNKLYAATNGAYLKIIDISNPIAMNEIGIYHNIATDYFNVVIKDNRAFIASSSGMLIVDVLNSKAPNLLKAITTYNTLDVALDSKNYAYFTTPAMYGPYGKLLIVDVSDPVNASIINTVPSHNNGAGSPDGVFVFNDLAYVSNASSINGENIGVQIIDIANPGTASELSFLNSYYTAEAITVDGRYFYTSNNKNNIIISDTYYDYLMIEQTVDKTAAMPNQEITYTLKITNPTPYTFTGSNNILSNEIPDGTTYVEGSVTGGGQYTNGKITWNLGQVNPNDTREVTFKVKVD